jgi:hypothetical protein
MHKQPMDIVCRKKMHAQHLDDSHVITLRIYLQLHSAKQ